ncbi:hypothetical protein AAFF_G00065430 [Aldrovandia affinis]|uniref:C2 domain-containing protein n=1 Tax=Aldrovandia affinis TaxID=143900 RepID=A0AAD7T3W1_9TELE|nr:hypothetical protein AAFF_G00065430 [Aldrovandia affinis]
MNHITVHLLPLGFSVLPLTTGAHRATGVDYDMSRYSSRFVVWTAVRMWFMERIRESVESLPQEMSRALGVEVSAKASLSSKLHSNVLTPDKIPEFFIPPRLSRLARVGAECTTAKMRLQTLRKPHPQNLSDLRAPPHRHIIEIEDMDGVSGGSSRRCGLGDGVRTVAGGRATALCGKDYGLVGLYESPNTRRKESLFLAEFTGRSLERVAYGRAPPTTALSEQGSTESKPPSSSDSTPHGSPVLTRSLSSSALFRLFGGERLGGRLSRSPSKQSLSRDGRGFVEECISFETRTGERAESTAPAPQSLHRTLAPPRSLALPECLSPPSSLTTPGSLAPPVLFPLDLLHCQERLQREHVLPLQGRGCVRLSAECDRAGATLRVRVVSVEDLHGSAPGGRLVHCYVSLCLNPGKRQRQNSATIRNCRNPVFNEDFFFTELSEAGLHSQALRLKVLDKASSIKRDVVLGVTSKPLSQLLSL